MAWEIGLWACSELNFCVCAFFPGRRGEICAQQSVVRNEKEVSFLSVFAVGMCVSMCV